MIATANAKSIEDIKSFLSRQKETYKAPYEIHPKDHKRQCVFAGTSNTLDFLPLDRTGNRRFLPVLVQAEAAEVHILEDEAASRAYVEQMWAEVMEVYRRGEVKLKLSPTMERYLKEHQRLFMPGGHLCHPDSEFFGRLWRQDGLFLADLLRRSGTFLL